MPRTQVTGKANFSPGNNILFARDSGMILISGHLTKSKLAIRSLT